MDAETVSDAAAHVRTDLCAIAERSAASGLLDHPGALSLARHKPPLGTERRGGALLSHPPAALLYVALVVTKFPELQRRDV